MNLVEKLKLIERLGRLHAEGALSDEEFAAEKANLLATGRLADMDAEPPTEGTPHSALPENYEAVSHHADGSRAKWIGAALAILFAVGGGYWVSQSVSASMPQDTLTNLAAASSGVEDKTDQTVTRAQLIGTWTPDQSCISDDSFVLDVDGTVGYEDGSGTWELERGQLVTIEEGERRSTKIIRVGDGQLALRRADGSIGKFRFCSTTQVAEAKRTAEADAILNEAGNAVENAAVAVEAAAVSDASSNNWRGVKGRCRLTVSGNAFIEGNCWVRLDDDGSFQIMSLDEKYFAQLNRLEGEAQGYWNQYPGSTHAQTRLGEMVRQGACWNNANAEICAWQ